MDEKEKFRLATGELIGYGIVGTMLDAAYETLFELDREMAVRLDDFTQEVLRRFHEAEKLLYSIGENDDKSSRIVENG